MSFTDYQERLQAATSETEIAAIIECAALDDEIKDKAYIMLFENALITAQTNTYKKEVK